MFCLSYSQFTFPKRLKVRIPYPISSSKDCADNTKHGGLIILIIILHASRYMRFNFTLPQTHIHREISYRAIQLYINHV